MKESYIFLSQQSTYVSIRGGQRNTIPAIVNEKIDGPGFLMFQVFVLHNKLLLYNCIF